jgi:hypothetical protein
MARSRREYAKKMDRMKGSIQMLDLLNIGVLRKEMRHDSKKFAAYADSGQDL